MGPEGQLTASPRTVVFLGASETLGYHVPADGDQLRDWDSEQRVARDPGKELHWSLLVKITFTTRSGSFINSRGGIFNT